MGFLATPPNREPALLPPGREGLFDDTQGAAVAADPAKFARILAWMIPNRTLPAGGAGGGGDDSAGIQSLAYKYWIATVGQTIDTVDMQKEIADPEGGGGPLPWPQERGVPGQHDSGWFHGDFRDVALPYVWPAIKKAIGRGNLDRAPNP